MAFIIDGKEALYNGEDYKFIKKHRASGNPNASVWICSFKEEFDLAENGLKSQYTERKNLLQAYNLNKGLSVLGKNDVNPKLKIAKFVNTSPNLWHGYPADHVMNNQDRPTLDVLSKMCSNGLISPKQMRKISKGQKI